TRSFMCLKDYFKPVVRTCCQEGVDLLRGKTECLTKCHIILLHSSHRISVNSNLRTPLGLMTLNYFSYANRDIRLVNRAYIRDIFTQFTHDQLTIMCKTLRCLLRLPTT